MWQKTTNMRTKKKMSTQTIRNLCWTQATCHEFEFCNFLLSEFCGYCLYISFLRFSWFMIIVCINVYSCLSCVSMLCVASMCQVTSGFYVGNYLSLLLCVLVLLPFESLCLVSSAVFPPVPLFTCYLVCLYCLNLHRYT